MRVAFITSVGPAPSWGFGGSEDLWIGTANRFLDDGTTVAVGMQFSLTLPKAVLDLHERGATIHFQHSIPSFRQRIIRKLGWPTRDSFAWLDCFRPDYVLISQNLFYDGFPAVRACQIRGLNFGVVIHTANNLFWPGDDVLESFAESYGVASACWFVSEATRRIVEHQTAVQLPNARLVRNPFRVKYESQQSWPEEIGGWRLASPGRLEPVVKGQDLLVLILSLQKWRERPLTVTLFGAGGQEKYLRRLAAIHNVNGQIIFGGVSRDIEQVWATHHCLVLPSRCEGMPLALVEAMICGRPAVVTNVGGNTELLTDGETGFVAQAVTVELLDAALERAWQRRSEWQQMGLRAREVSRALIPADPIGTFTEEIRSLLRDRTQ